MVAVPDAPHDLTPPDTEPLMRGDEVAQFLNVSKSKAYELLASGAIPRVRIGRAVRVRPSALRAWLHMQEAGE